MAAVITALYLASRSQKIKLSGYCGIRLVVSTGGPQQQLVFLSVTNIGSRTATICNIGMSVGRFKKRHAIIAALKDIYSDGIPVTLADGQVAKWGIPLNKEMQWIKELVGGFVKTESDAHTLRFLVFPTHGAAKAIKPDHSLVEPILEALRSKNG